MRRGDRETWSALVGISNLIHVALYVRDVCRLQVGQKPTIPPPLDGGVAGHSGAIDSESRLRPQRSGCRGGRRSSGSRARNPPEHAPWTVRHLY